MKKIVFCDIDGTIIDNIRGMYECSLKTKYSFNALKDDACAFIASGRCKCMLDKQLLSLEPQGFILANGAYAEYQGKVIYERKFSIEMLEKIANYCLKNGLNYYFEDQERVYVNDMHNKLHYDFNYAWKLDDIYCEDDYHDKSINIVMIACPSEELCQKAMAYLEPYLDVRHHHGFPSFDVNLRGNNKADAIEKVLDYLSINKDNAFAFGDGLNDIEMLQTVKYGIAMANAYPELKAVAYDVTDDVLDDGLYSGLLKYSLIKPID